MKAPGNKDEILEMFRKGPAILDEALEGLSDKELDYIPTGGGWSIRQIVHHLTDGDDIWKYCIKMALGNEQSEFSLNWYKVFPQTEWADKWNYEKRPLDASLTLLKANRDHIIQLLEYASDGWSKSAGFRNREGEIERIPAGFIVEMQAQHIVHHVKRIKEIRKEFLHK